MNEFQVNTILAVMADAHSVLQERFEERGREIDRLQDRLYEQDDKIREHNRVVEDRDYFRQALGKAQEDFQKAMAELRQYRANDPSVKGKADAFMAEHPDLHVKSRKIDCIVQVRQLTGWGLKEAKDYVEAYVAAEADERTKDAEVLSCPDAAPIDEWHPSPNVS